LSYVKIQKSRKREWALCWSVVFFRTWNQMSPMRSKNKRWHFCIWASKWLRTASVVLSHWILVTFNWRLFCTIHDINQRLAGVFISFVLGPLKFVFQNLVGLFFWFDLNWIELY
jgi:hypothetical protein